MDIVIILIISPIYREYDFQKYMCVSQSVLLSSESDPILMYTLTRVAYESQMWLYNVIIIITIIILTPLTYTNIYNDTQMRSYFGDTNFCSYFVVPIPTR